MKAFSPPVFYYHSVAPSIFENWILRGLTLKLEIFENQLAYLVDEGVKTIFLDEWFAMRQKNKKGTGKAVCLAFDDGLLDNWVYAFPLAKKYGVKFTIFISPECVDPRNIVRPTIEDSNKSDYSEKGLDDLGYMSWQELIIMQESGLVDIQSHTMTHAKYPSSDNLKRYYYGGFPGMHTILNANPELRWWYMRDPDFSNRIPLGTPIFEEKSSVVTRKYFPSSRFTEELLKTAKEFELNDEKQQVIFEKLSLKIYNKYKINDKLIEAVETEENYQKRIIYEIVESKKQLEENLKKSVKFLCWPHGENNLSVHALAKKAGYLATTSGKMTSEKDKPDRIPRIGACFRNGTWASKLKFQYKISSHYKKQPWYMLWKANELRHELF